MKEVWVKYKDIPYEVSSEGRVRRIPGMIYCPLNGSRFHKGGILRPSKKGKYKIIDIDQMGRRITILAHRMIADVFVDNPENKPHVNHIDGKKENNHPSNLEWVTHKENMMHARTTGLIANEVGVIAYRDGELFEFESLVEASLITGASKPCICAALKGKQKTAGRYKWKYREAQAA